MPRTHGQEFGQCRLLARLGRSEMSAIRPLSRVKRTFNALRRKAEYDPERSFASRLRSRLVDPLPSDLPGHRSHIEPIGLPGSATE